MRKDIFKHIGKEFYEKCVLSAVLLTFFTFLPKVGYENGDTENIGAHVAYMFCHVNIWHLAGNLFVLWIVRGKLYVVPSLLIAFLASLIPAFSIWGDVGVTMGFSGVLFAMWGVKWGIYCHRKYGMDFTLSTYREFLLKAVSFALIGILIPHLNWCIHLYSLLAGYIYGRCRR